MLLLGANFVLRGPDWPVFLKAAAALVLLWELAALLRWIWSGAVGGGHGSAAAARTVALLAAPVVAIVAAIYRLLFAAGPAKDSAGRMAKGCLYFTILLGLAFATFWQPLVPYGAIVAIAFAAAVWGVRSYGRTTAPLKRGWKVLLLAMRMVAILLLALWLFHPTLTYQHTEKVRQMILFGVDVSASMSRRDMPADYTSKAPAGDAEPVARIAAVKQAIEHERAELEKLAGQADVRFFLFPASEDESAAFQPQLGRVNMGKADGPVTAIGDEVLKACDPLLDQKREIKAIVVMSDGCNNVSDQIEPDKMADLMASRGIALSTVVVGAAVASPSTRSISVKELVAADEVDTYNNLPISATVEVLGLVGKHVKVTCRLGNEEVGTQTLNVDDKSFSAGVQFTHVPTASGYQRLSVEAKCIDPPQGEIAGQPQANKLVHVLNREMRVLYVEGKFRYEAKYIARALEGSRRFSLDRRVLLRSLSEEATSPLSDKLEDWLGYNAIIIGDVAASRFTDAQIRIMKELVEKYGKGICMLGGQNAFAAGGWDKTPLADVMPVDLKTSSGQDDKEMKAAPTPDGLTNPAMQIGESDSDVAAAWDKLPMLQGANVLGAPKPGASVLLKGPGGNTLAAAQQYGKGRSMVIAFDTTWRWVLSPPPETGRLDCAQEQRRFWRQVAMYLADPKGNIWIATDKGSYDHRRLVSGKEVINVTAGLEDANGQPAPGVPVEAALIDPAGKSVRVKLALDESDPKKQRKAMLPPPSAPGVYKLTIKARISDRELNAEHQFEVLRQDLESLEVLANVGLMKRMAARGNGQCVMLADFAKLLTQLEGASAPREVLMPPRMDDLSDKYSWPVIATILALLCLEWAIRKRKGLV
jgi:uncharacterized membrane protein